METFLFILVFVSIALGVINMLDSSKNNAKMYDRIKNVDRKIPPDDMYLGIDILTPNSMPTKATKGSNGYDCFASISRFIDMDEDKKQHCRGFTVKNADGDIPYIELKPDGKVIIPLGFKLYMHSHIMAKFLPRSGVSLKTDIVIPNSPGLGDTDYTGEMFVTVRNTGNKTLSIAEHSRLCQVVFERSINVTFNTLSEPTIDGGAAPILETQATRGSNGHGSSGN